MLVKEKIKQINKAILNYERRFSLLVANNSEINEVIDYIYGGNWELFHVSNVSIKFMKEYKTAIFHLNYACMQDQYLSLRIEIEKKLRIISSELLKLNDEYEKELYIHDYICSNVKYKLLKNKEEHTIIGPLLRGYGVCDGIAKLGNILFNIAKIESHYVEGRVITCEPPDNLHAWNIVKINGGYYHLDITCDCYMRKGKTVKRYDCFNINNEEISLIYNINDRYKKLSEKCNSLKENYFVKNKLLFSDRKILNSYIKRSISEKKRLVYFKVDFKSKDSFFKTITDKIIVAYNLYQVHQYFGHFNNLMYLVIKY